MIIDIIDKNIQLFKALSDDIRYRTIKALLGLCANAKRINAVTVKESYVPVRPQNSFVELSPIPQYILQSCRTGR